jgi:iron complex transport system ATP-binding protein
VIRTGGQLRAGAKTTWTRPKWLRHNPDLPALPRRGESALRADSVSVRKGGALVLDRVSLDVRAGEILMLVGPNGAGKSTLLAALAGDAPLVEGAVTLAGVELSSWSPGRMARRRAVLPQSHIVGFSFTAEEVVRMGRAPWSRTPRMQEDDEAVAESMRLCDVTHVAHRPFAALSGGEKARVALARALAQRTGALLLDEPTAALDLRHQEDVMRIVRDRAQAGAAVVVVMHDLALASAYGDRVAVLDDGRLRTCGDTAHVLTAELLSSVYRSPIEVIAHPRTGERLILPERAGTAAAPGDRDGEPGCS